MKPSVYISDGDWRAGAVEMFRRAGYVVTRIPDLADMLCLMGGADVNPALYGEKNVASYCSVEQDNDDRELFEQFEDRPKVGICRGGQFLNVMSGGRMWQDVDAHTGTHDLIDLESDMVIKVSSTHHQMMRPEPTLGRVIATCKRSSYRKSAEGMVFRYDDPYDDIEIVYYDHTQSLCYQPHPEIGPDENVDYFFRCIKKYLGVSA